MKKTNIIITVGIVIVVIIAFIIASRVSNVPSRFTPFAQGLKDSGLKFYGAFWCPHCQAQEKQFEMSRQSLEKMGLYTECSLSDGKGQTIICTDKKIESYPTWVYPKDFSVTSATPPTLCEVQPGPDGQSTLCVSYGSKFLKTWIFTQQTPVLTVQSASEPKIVGDVWTFVAGSRTTGEVSLENLSHFSGVALPVTPEAAAK
jgi:thiol-disulfide isomerase/thioredoxin